MAISEVTSQRGGATSTTTSVTATYPATPTSGDTLLATVYANVTSGLATMPSGWSLLGVETFSGTAQSVQIFGKVAGSSEPTSITCNGLTGSTQTQMYLYEFSGLASTLTQDGSAVVNNSGSSNVSSLASGSITTANANELLFIANATGGASSGPSWTNSFTSMQTTQSRHFDAYLVASTASSYSTTCSWTNSLKAGSVLIALNSTTGGGGVTTNPAFLLNFI